MIEKFINNIVKLVSIGSTNNYAIQYMRENNWQEGTVFYTNVQNEGRGQVNNRWESEPHKNILTSVLLRPDFLPIMKQFQISKIAALAVYDIVAAFASNTAIKWPNDIYIGKRKVAGILIENSIMGSVLNSSVVGIGLNVNQEIFTSDAPNPISLKQEIGIELNLDEILNNLVSRINYYYFILKHEGNPHIDKLFLEHLFQIGVLAEYNDEEGNFMGTIKGVNEIGQLQIEKQNGQLKAYHFKEVRFL